MKITVSYFLTISVVVISLYLKNIFLKQEDNIKVIKFMYSKEYLFDYGEKMFWDNKEDHATMYQNKFEIKKLVEGLPKSSSKSFKNYNYCFLVSKNEDTDTIYADFSLKAWILKNDGKKSYYYDKDGNLANNLRAHYSFFKECW